MIVIQAEVGTEPVVLAETRAWENHGVDPRAQKQQDPITTQLTPTVVAEKGTTTWLLRGHRLHTHDAPGDTLSTYQMLFEVDSAGVVEGWWHEDHMEVPTSLWRVTGKLDGHTLTLSLTGDEPRTVQALYYRRGAPAPRPKR
ncbi:MAG: hypothetical protein Q8P41_04715 [Pseudomonadota bacterium]|nr:hypothetical protein [Pseudomonadota bacterium]